MRLPIPVPKQALLLGGLIVAATSLQGCLPLAVRAAQAPYHARMDELENRMVELRAERRLVIEKLKTDDEATRQDSERRLVLINTEMKDIAIKLDLPVSQ